MVPMQASVYVGTSRTPTPSQLRKFWTSVAEASYLLHSWRALRILGRSLDLSLAQGDPDPVRAEERLHALAASC